MTAIGAVSGDFIYVKGTNKTTIIAVNNMSYAAESSRVSLLAPQFGIFEGENFNAVFQYLQANQLQLNNTALFTINCNPSIQSVNYACGLKITGSTLQGLTLNSSIISINSQTSSSFGPLTMLSVMLQDTLFSSINWFTEASSSGIVSSSTSLIGRNQGDDNFAIIVQNCTFSNLTGAGGLIYNGIESMYDLVLWLNNNTVNSTNFEGSGAIISTSTTQLTSFSSSLSSNSSRNASYLLTQNEFAFLTATENPVSAAAGVGRIINWSSQARGVSISLQNNTFTNVNNTGGDGAIFYLSYTFNRSGLLVNSSIGLSPEYMIFISSANNSYKHIYAQSGVVLCSRGDTQLLQVAFESDSMGFITSSQNGGVFDIEYVPLSTASSSSSSPLSSRLLGDHSGFNNHMASPTRELVQSMSTEGMITILGCSFTSISGNNGGIIYEQSPPSSIVIAVINSSFSSVSASTRGGVFWLNQPNLLASQNNFSYISAGLAGTISYSLSDQVNISNLVIDNMIVPSPNMSLVAYGPTSLRVILVSIVDNSVTLLPLSNEAVSSCPMFLNLTSYSLSQYVISLTLVYQKDPNDLSDYEIVLDESENYLLSMNFSFVDSINNQTYSSKNCSNSTCNILAPSVILKGQSGDLINVSALYLSDTYIKSQNFSIQLRSCTVGEVNDAINQECFLCNSGTYSLNINDLICQECPIGAICNGGNNISLISGYYRSIANNFTLNIVPCNDSGTKCLGGDDQTNCSDVYSGIVCSQCNFRNSYLSSAKAGECTQCYEKTRLILFGIFLLGLSIAYQIIITVVTYNENKNIYAQYVFERTQKKMRRSSRKTEVMGNSIIALQQEQQHEHEIEGVRGADEENEKKKKIQKNLRPGAFLIIFVTFSQISFTISDLDVGTARTLIGASASAGNSNKQVVFSLQCLYLLAGSNLFEGLQSEILVYVFSPIVKLTLVAILELLRTAFTYIIKTLQSQTQRHNNHPQGEAAEREETRRGGEREEEEEKQDEKNDNHNNDSSHTAAIDLAAPGKTSSVRSRSLIRIGAVAVVLFLIEQPGIISELFQYLTCIKLDPFASQYYIKSQNNIECYTDEYNSFLYAAIIPSLIFWAFIAPLALILTLYINRKRLFDSEAFSLILGNFYNPYPKEAYYWGIVLIIFKISIFILDAVLTSSDFAKGVVLMIVIHAYFVLFKRKLPYVSDSLNRAQNYCILTYMMVLTMVLLRISAETEWLYELCNVVIMMSVISAGGYVLINVFWRYIIRVWEVIKKVRKGKKTQKTKYETSDPSKIDHYDNTHSRRQEQEGATHSQIELQFRRQNATNIDLSIK